MTEKLTRQALETYGQPLVELTEDLPTIQGGEILVKIRHCGVCHSDLHLQDGHFDYGGEQKASIAGLHKMPHTLGHEIEGEVVAVGPDASGVSVGERRAVYPWIGCGSCSNCKKEVEHLCDAPRALGITRAGGYATHVVVPDTRYLIDYTGIPAEVAGSLMCAGLTGYAALKKLPANVSASPKLIIGLGGVGMMALKMANLMFETAPVVAELDPAKREEALAMGALDAFDPTDRDAVKAAKKKHGLFDGIVDFVGNPKTVQLAMSLVNKGGRVVIVGLFGGEMRYPIPMLAQREVSVVGSYVSSLPDAIEMMELVKAKGGVGNVSISTRPMNQASAALDDLRAGKVNGRVVLTD